MLQAIAGLIILSMMLPSLIGLWDMGITKTQQRVAAEHLQAVSRASSQYVRKHQTTLISSATPSSGPTVTVDNLVADGLLPTGFKSRNLWGQNYQVYIRQPQPDALQAIVLTQGGRAATLKFINSTVPGAAVMAGGAGGYVPSGVLPGQSTDQLLGAGGGWAISLPGMGISSPGPGHLGALSSFDSSSLGQDFLYRVAVPGNPELNAMQTELDMTDHAIRNVSEVQFVERDIDTEACTTPEEQGRVFLDRAQGLYLCRNNALEVIGDTGNSAQIRRITLARNGDKIDKPICAPNTNTLPMIFVAPSIAEVGPEAPPISSLQTWATSLSDTQWQVHLRILISDKNLSLDNSGWVYPAENYARIMTLATCGRDVVTP